MELIQTTLPALVEGGYTKKEIASVANSLINDVLDNGRILQMAERISATEQLIKEIKADKRFADYVREELIKYKGKYSTEIGSKIEAAETGTKYDFSVCGDAEHDHMESQINGLEDMLKKRKEFLKTVPPEGLTVVNTFTGEVETIYPPVKTSTSSYKITLAK